MDKVFYAVLFIGVIVLMVLAMNVGMSRQFVTDCYKWQKYEREIQQFELEASLVEECSKHGVSIK